MRHGSISAELAAVVSVGAGDRGLAAAQAYLDTVRAAPRVAAPTVGKGRYAVLTGRVIGRELVDGERVVQLSAFP